MYSIMIKIIGGEEVLDFIQALFCNSSAVYICVYASSSQYAE